MTMVLSRRRLLVAAIAAGGMQIALILSMVASNSAILEEGVAVTLRAQPVDPRDLLRGEYVTLGYSFSALNAALVRDPWPTQPGEQTLWLRLKPGPEGVSDVSEAAFEPLPPEAGSVVLKSEPFPFNPTTEKPLVVRATYGLERYYVPEGQGKALEAARDTHRILVDARITPDGTARIASLRVEP